MCRALKCWSPPPLTTPRASCSLLSPTPTPVLLFEHKLLYKAKGPVPEGYYTVAIGKAVVRREGRDLTLVACGIMVPRALETAQTLLGEGIEVEVIDPRSLRPLDMPAIIASVKKTSRLMCVYEGVKAFGVGAEIAAAVAESEAFDYLDAPIVRLGGADAPVPYSPALERAMAPQIEDIVAAARQLARS
jgi:pyruvate/2-oxoglutarate/acetoin dehydrogenase E1 component